MSHVKHCKRNILKYLFRSYFAEALEVIGTVLADDNRKIEDTLKVIKEQMSLQILCFSIDGL